MKISMACDHGGLALKEHLKAHLLERGFEVVDFGTDSTESCDYPDYARPAAEAVASGECDRGILVCTTGIGVSITANKVKGIRCALLSDTVSARLTRQHNNTNMMARPLRAAAISAAWTRSWPLRNERYLLRRRIEKPWAVQNRCCVQTCSTLCRFADGTPSGRALRTVCRSCVHNS